MANTAKTVGIRMETALNMKVSLMARMSGESVSEYIRGVILHNNMRNALAMESWDDKLVLEFLQRSHQAYMDGASLVDMGWTVLPVFRPVSHLENESFPVYQQHFLNRLGARLHGYEAGFSPYSQF